MNRQGALRFSFGRQSILRGLVLLWLAAMAVPAQAQDYVSEYFELNLPDGTPIRACWVRQPGDVADIVPSPVIFEWTSYSIEPISFPASGCPPQFLALAQIMVPEGYIFVAANSRGVARSGSDFDTADQWSRADGRDGAEIVEWINQQPWSNGKIAVIGCSNSAMMALQLAVHAPPALDALAPSCAGVDSYRGSFYLGGIRARSILFSYLARPAVDTDIPGGQVQEQLTRGQITFATRALSDTETTARVYNETEDSEFWEDKSPGYLMNQINVPVFWHASWHDFFGRGGGEFAMNFIKPGDRLTFYPGGHGSALAIPGPYSGLTRTKVWLDHQLKDLPDPFATEKQIVYWENNGGLINGLTANPIEHRFYETDIWPPADVAYERWYLQPGRVGMSEGSLNDGGLARTVPPANALDVGDAYPYPCACPGQANDPPQNFGADRGWDEIVEDAGGAVVYTSPALRSPMHLAGPITLNLWATSTANDTDWIVKLLAVSPEGTFRHITDGFLKASHRALDESQTLRNVSGEIIRPYHPHRNIEDIPLPGVTGPTPVEYSIELWQTATVVPAGWSLKLWISSSAQPSFLQEIPPATNTVLHTPVYPSSLLLPVQPQSAIVRIGADAADLYRGTTYYQESVEVNSILQYNDLSTDVINLPEGTTHYPLKLVYSEHMQAGSFRGALNFNQGFGWWFFNPIPGTSETVNVPLQPGRNTIHLRGIVGSEAGNQDGARNIKDIDIFRINVGD